MRNPNNRVLIGVENNTRTGLANNNVALKREEGMCLLECFHKSVR